jgi:hypothetical protein
MNELNFWYIQQTTEKKSQFRSAVMQDCGVSEETVYNYLKNEAPKLTKYILSQYSGIDTGKLYQPIKIQA